MSVDHMGFEPSGTPPAGVGGPAKPLTGQGAAACFGDIAVKVFLKGTGRFQPGDGPANVSLQFVQMLVHLGKFHGGIAE